jgi:radical SAM superfamily enzyme YgiQ (UPF0313 family)
LSIVLIIPPSPFLGDEKRQPPLGILYVAAYLEQQRLNVRIIDLRSVPSSGWMDKIPVCGRYGITATTPEYPYAVLIAEGLKLRDKMMDKKCHISLGGVHGTALAGTIERTLFDTVVIGEGDGTAPLDERPFPARHLLPRESFISDKLCEAGESATTVMVSRGCAFDCSFCSSKAMWGRNVRYRSVGNVIAELQMLKREYGIHQIRFHDDTMTVNKPWIMEFCGAVAPLNLRWRAATRVDRSSADMLQAMFDAGCYELAYGIEDPDQDVLNINNKGVKTKDIYKALATAKRIGFKTRLYLMIGLPGQDDKTAKRLIDFIERVEPTVADLSTFVPFPGSDVYNNPDKYDIKLKDTPWDDYVFTRGLYGDECAKDFIYQHDRLSNESLKQQRKEILDHIKKRHIELKA